MEQAIALISKSNGLLTYAKEKIRVNYLIESICHNVAVATMIVLIIIASCSLTETEHGALRLLICNAVGLAFQIIFFERRIYDQLNMNILVYKVFDLNAKTIERWNSNISKYNIEFFNRVFGSLGLAEAMIL